MFIDKSQAIPIIYLINYMLGRVFINVANHNHICFLVFDGSPECFRCWTIWTATPVTFRIYNILLIKILLLSRDIWLIDACMLSLIASFGLSVNYFIAFINGHAENRIWETVHLWVLITAVWLQMLLPLNIFPANSIIVIYFWIR